MPQTAARAIFAEPDGFTYGFTCGSAPLGPPSFAKEALSVPQTAARAILAEPDGFAYGFTYGSASLGPPSFAKEALSASRF